MPTVTLVRLSSEQCWSAKIIKLTMCVLFAQSLHISLLPQTASKHSRTEEEVLRAFIKIDCILNVFVEYMNNF